uniref:LigA n=1 Tax=Parastrongyloides trichosuri TaxID=131310 RepID=A0A0N4ZK87_PARTI
MAGYGIRSFEPDRAAADRIARRQRWHRAPAQAAADAGRVSGAGPPRFFRVRACLHGRVRHPQLSHRSKPEPDRQGVWAEPFHPRQLPCPGDFRHQRRKDGEKDFRNPRHRHRASRAAQLRRPPARSVAGAPDGVASGNCTAAVDARRARARPAPGRTGRQERRVQVVHRRSGLGVLAVARCWRPARGRHCQAVGSTVAADRTPGARPEHPDRNAGAVHPLLPDRQHAGARSPSGCGTRPGQGALRAV